MASPLAILLVRSPSPSLIFDPSTGARIAEFDSGVHRPLILGETFAFLSAAGLAIHDLRTGARMRRRAEIDPPVLLDEHGIVGRAAYSWHDGPPAWTCPAGLNIRSITRTQVYGEEGRELVVLDRATGREIRRASGFRFLAADDAGFVASGLDGWGAPLLVFDAGGRQLWNTAAGGYDKIVEDLTPEVVVGSMEGYDRHIPGFFVLDRRSGEVMGHVSQGEFTSVMTAGDRIYADDGRELQVFSLKGERLARFALPDGDCLRVRSIAVSGDRVYVDAPGDMISCLRYA